MLPDLGQYVGRPAFEQARGVVMEVCGFTADEALVALITFTRQTGIDIEQTVSRLRTLPALYGPLRAPEPREYVAVRSLFSAR